MTAAVQTSGSQTAVIGTEHTLATLAVAGTYMPVVDLNALAIGDVVELRVYAKLAVSGDPERLVYVGAYANKQQTPLVVGPPLLTPVSLRFTLTQTTGTARSFPWGVWKP